MGYTPFGTDISDRMIEYSAKNLTWLQNSLTNNSACAIIEPCVGDATNFDWKNYLQGQKISAVACETYLGQPMSAIPPEIKLRTVKSECYPIIHSFLKNLSPQLNSGTPVVIAIPAWKRENGSYSRLNIVDNLSELGYNVMNISGNLPLLYHREDQIVAREIIILRKV